VVYELVAGGARRSTANAATGNTRLGQRPPPAAAPCPGARQAAQVEAEKIESKRVVQMVTVMAKNGRIAIA
jgi:hypothetical protein